MEILTQKVLDEDYKNALETVKTLAVQLERMRGVLSYLTELRNKYHIEESK